MAFFGALRLRLFLGAACVASILGAAIACSVNGVAAEPSDTEAQSHADQQTGNGPLPETKTQSKPQHGQPITVPLKSIWGGHLQGNRMFGQFDLDMPPGLAPSLLGVDIDKALATPPADAAKPGFVVLGKSGEALLGAHAVLVENKKPLAPIPANSEVSLVFFTYASDFSAHLHDVEVDGHDITVRYQFVPETIKDLKSTYALISLGKLSAGDYHVAMTQLPMDQKYIQRGSKPPSDEDVHRLVCQPFAFSVHPSDIAFKEVGQLDGIGGSETRFGTRDRMIFVDDVWELDRCARLIPDLPWIDLRKESLLILMNWKWQPRSIESVHSEGDTLIIGLKEPPPPTAIADSWHPPKYLVARLPVWPGPVRFEVNGQLRFTMERGEKLAKLADQIWEEILTLHSGGRVNRIEFVRYLKSRSPNISDQEAIEAAFDKTKLLSTPAAAVYPMLFAELVDIRARPIIPRIFELLKATGKFDPILEHANNSLIGIGGPEVIVHAKEALNSLNPRCRETTMRALAGIGDPEARPIAYECFNSADLAAVRDGLTLLNGIGPRREDVPEIVRGMQQFESLLFDPQIATRTVSYGSASEEQISTAIYTLGSLGAQAEDALPTLEQMATKPRYPLSTSLQEPAQKAVEKIKIDLSKSSP